MAVRSSTFPSGHLLLAVLLLLLYISPTHAFGAGNIGRAPPSDADGVNI